MLGSLCIGLLAASVLPPGNAGGSNTDRTVVEAVEAIKRAYQRQYCDGPAFAGESELGSQTRKSFPIRVWIEGSRFLVEVKDRYFWAPVLHDWGCITKEGEASFVSSAGSLQMSDEVNRATLGEWYELFQKQPQYVGTLILEPCGEQHAEPCPAKAEIIEGVLDLIRYYLSLDPQDQQLLDAGRIVVTIGEFSCFSESVWVLVEPTERPVWQIKLLRGDTCEDMSIIPKGFRLMYSWPLRFPEDEPDLWPPYNNPLPLTRADVARLRAHGTVVRLTPKPQVNSGTAQAPPEAGKEQKTEDKNTGSCLCCPSPAKHPGSSERP
jgi:hypothetical protein